MKVIANSIPKSGTHLFVRLLDLIGMTESDLHLSGSLVRFSNKNLLHSYRVWKRRSSVGYSVDLDQPKRKIKRAALEELVGNKINNNQFSEAHLPYSSDLTEFLTDCAKVVYITRDPRAIVASHIAHAYKVEGYPLRKIFDQCTEDEKVRLILDGYRNKNYVLTPLKNRISDSIEWKNDSRIYHTTFERLIGSNGGGSDNEQLNEVEKILSFLQYDGSGSVKEIASQIFYKKSETFNKGMIDGWKNLLSNSQIEIVNKSMGSIIMKLGYE